MVRSQFCVASLGMSHSKNRNEEMRRVHNSKLLTFCYCIKCDENVNVCPAFIERSSSPYSLHLRDTYAKALHHGWQASTSLFGSLLAVIKSVNCSHFAPTFYKE